MRVTLVCKDTGGMSGVLPVLHELKSRGHACTLLANGVSVKSLTNRGDIPFITADSASEALTDEVFESQVLVTSMCSNGGVGRDLVPIFRRELPNVPIVALQDFWGARLKTDWVDTRYRPDLICVNDTVGADIVRSAWPGFESTAITGFPALDKYAFVNKQTVNKHVRGLLGVTATTRLILYAGQTTHTGATLKELTKALVDMRIRDPWVLVPLRHPRMHSNAPEELPLWDEALDQLTTVEVIRDTRGISSTDLVMAADVVVSMFSTMLIEAACMRAHPIAILYERLGMQVFLEETGRVMNEFPLVSLGCCEKAEGPHTLRRALAGAFEDPGRFAFEHEHHFPNQGKNTSNVADAIEKLARA